jgi:hypothetical protein
MHHPINHRGFPAALKLRIGKYSCDNHAARDNQSEPTITESYLKRQAASHAVQRQLPVP